MTGMDLLTFRSRSLRLLVIPLRLEPVKWMDVILELFFFLLGDLHSF